MYLFFDSQGRFQKCVDCGQVRDLELLRAPEGEEGWTIMPRPEKLDARIGQPCGELIGRSRLVILDGHAWLEVDPLDALLAQAALSREVQVAHEEVELARMLAGYEWLARDRELLATQVEHRQECRSRMTDLRRERSEVGFATLPDWLTALAGKRIDLAG